jgi:hypothetical protein
MGYKSREEKHKEAIIRAEEWRKLTLEQQLVELDKRLGKGKGATKQRANIAKQLAKKGKSA